MSDIGKAYVQIIPTAEGIKGKLSDMLEGEASDAGEKSGGAFSKGMGKALGGLAKVSAASMAAAGTAVGALAKQSVDAYKDFEQLEGGIETLFGTGGKTFEEFAKSAKATKADIENSGIDWSKYLNVKKNTKKAKEEAEENLEAMKSGIFADLKHNIEDLKMDSAELQKYLEKTYKVSAEDATTAINAYKNAVSDSGIQSKFNNMVQANAAVMENAEKAYKTAGMSMNQYMETSIQSAAAMINSLGGDQKKAAELMDMSIIDMADNVNKMGTSMEGVQNAYRGFSRGNFTMLDNLALGFAGTQAGMQELLDTAKQLSGVEYDIESYADIVQAIHVVQEEMGIAGTTAKEGAETIEGSLNQLKAAWENLTGGLANPDADIGKLIDNVVESAEAALDNMMPAIEHALIGIATFIEKAAPIIADRLPGIIEKILPSLLKAANILVNSFIKAMPDIIEAISKTVAENPEIITTLGPILAIKMAGGLLQNLDKFEPVGKAISKKLGSSVGKSLPNVFKGLGPKLSTGLSSFGKLLTADMGSSLAAGGATAGATIGTAIVGGIAAAIGGAEIGKKLGAVLFPEDAELYEEYSGITGTFTMLKDFFVTLGEEIGYGLSDLWANISGFFSTIAEAWNTFWTEIYDFCKPVLDAIQYTAGIIFDAISEKIRTKLEEIKTYWTTVWEALNIVFAPIIESIQEKLLAFCEKATEIFNAIMSFVEEKIFPLLYAAQEKVAETIDGIKNKFAEDVEGIKEIFNGLGEFFSALFDKAKTWGSDLMESFKQGIIGKRDEIAATVRGVGDIIKAIMGHSHPTEGPLADDYKWMPDMMDLFIQGINDGEGDIQNAMSALAGGVRGSMPMLASSLHGGGAYSAAVSPAGYGDLTVPVYIGSQKFAQATISANQINNYRSGGR